MGLAQYARAHTFRMLGGYVLVEMLEDRSVLTLIVAPSSSYKRPERALVLSAGPESTLRPGEVVLVDPYKFALVLADGGPANAERTPYAGIGDRAVIHAEHVRVVLEEDDHV